MIGSQGPAEQKYIRALNKDIFAKSLISFKIGYTSTGQEIWFSPKNFDEYKYYLERNNNHGVRTYESEKTLAQYVVSGYKNKLEAFKLQRDNTPPPLEFTEYDKLASVQKDFGALALVLEKVDQVELFKYLGTELSTKEMEYLKTIIENDNVIDIYEYLDLSRRFKTTQPDNLESEMHAHIMSKLENFLIDNPTGEPFLAQKMLVGSLMSPELTMVNGPSIDTEGLLRQAQLNIVPPEIQGGLMPVNTLVDSLLRFEDFTKNPLDFLTYAGPFQVLACAIAFVYLLIKNKELAVKLGVAGAAISYLTKGEVSGVVEAMGRLAGWSAEKTAETLKGPEFQACKFFMYDSGGGSSTRKALAVERVYKMSFSELKEKCKKSPDGRTFMSIESDDVETIFKDKKELTRVFTDQNILPLSDGEIAGSLNEMIENVGKYGFLRDQVEKDPSFAKDPSEFMKRRGSLLSEMSVGGENFFHRGIELLETAKRGDPSISLAETVRNYHEKDLMPWIERNLTSKGVTLDTIQRYLDSSYISKEEPPSWRQEGALAEVVKTEEDAKTNIETNFNQTFFEGIATKYGIDDLTEPNIQNLFRAIMFVESRGKFDVKNPDSSATGLYQFTEETWRSYYTQAYDHLSKKGGPLDLTAWPNPQTTKSHDLFALAKNPEIATVVKYYLLGSYLEGGKDQVGIEASFPLNFGFGEIKDGLTREEFYKIFVKHHDGQNSNLGNITRYPAGNEIHYPRKKDRDGKWVETPTSLKPLLDKLETLGYLRK